MRILKLRFANLNSIYGEWEVDFSCREFRDQGIFAITGPTGSGKSTLLDALCLALYGRTPRLKNISASTNHIMSRGTGECFSELSFETPAGRYRCFWQQHRSRKKAQGNLRDSRHEISELDTGKILEEKKREVALRVIEITGMDFERFTRSMLLAQGGFAAFLQAAAQERAPILEQITGMDIYSQISKEVHQRYRQEQEKLDILSLGLDAQELLTQEQWDSLEKEKKLLQEMLTSLKKQLQQRVEQNSLEEQLVQLETRQKQLEIQMDILEKNRSRVKKLKEDITRGDLWFKLEPQWLELEKLDQQLKNRKEEISLRQKQLKATQNQAEGEADTLNLSRRELSTMEEQLSDLQILRRKLDPLDAVISEKNRQLLQIVEDLTGRNQSCQSLTENLLKLEIEQKKLQHNIHLAEDYQHSHKNQAELSQEYSRLQEQIKQQDQRLLQLKTLEEQLKENQFKSNRAKETLQTAEKEYQGIEKILEGLQIKQRELDDLEKDLLQGKLLRELRSRKEHLQKEQWLLQKIQNLEEQRESLVAGEPCPLCGSTDHPYSNSLPGEDKNPEIDRLNRRLKNLEELEDQRKILGQKFEENRLKLSQKERGKWELQGEQQDLEKQHQRLAQDQKLLQEAFDNLQDELLKQLKPLGIIRIEKNLPDQLQNQINQWQLNQEKLLQFTNERQNITPRIEGLNQQKKLLEQQNGELQTQRDKIHSDLEKLKKERKALFGNNNAAEEEESLRINRETAQKKLEGLSREMEKNKLNEQAQRSSLETMVINFDEQDQGYQRALGEFTEQLNAAQWKNPQCYLLESEIYSNLPQWKGELDQAEKEEHQWHIETQQLKKNKEQSSAEYNAFMEENKNLPPQKELEEQIGETQQTLGSINEKQQQYQQQKERAAQRQKELGEQRQRQLRWAKLHQLIGSADGRKYREFAQTITFKRLIAQSNLQLQSLSDRYLLIAHETEPLELDVLDLYQAGDIRSTRNLSGGESFLVSLALALGLSSMASRRVPVDSLFLDEGFGTLDEETLDMALSALGELRQQGKLIGVISHVQALKDRMALQIKVEPQRAGKSIISGPGCRKV
ncbi:MAG: AAA family ATPase [Spirochaetaceae bacterium]|jgi:exonuclease SbcC|nr:AAA family ATPase [Spirochaetaceae bacterium]